MVPGDAYASIAQAFDVGLPAVASMCETSVCNLQKQENARSTILDWRQSPDCCTRPPWPVTQIDRGGSPRKPKGPDSAK